jgi:hypothetical protein
MCHARASTEMNAELWWGNLKERPFERLKSRWENNIKMNLTETYWYNVVHLAQDRDTCG